ncbi:outer membrane protein OmpA-like peptidoglycan-associated protein [Paraburkholderia sp. CI2]|uniref:OmpA family protein n=1 Tax=Paraburkholderia sp. CI2 TaxID=2723093 RepID=UPI0017AEEB06|nr:OmpA family protein [Paraburkholderia sp. CI2]MBB5464377.1 outer membrane protein OmpA-like peptidoglycan-associated protein [Paraburkholderia sp. CI2]
MKSDLRILSATPTRTPDRAYERLGYPWRAMLVFTAVLALAAIWFVLPGERGIAWALTAVVGLLVGVLVGWRTLWLSRAGEQSAQVLAALGASTAGIPPKLRTRMPLVLVTGDGLPALFDRNHEERFAHVGDGAIWLRVDHPQQLPRLAVALRQWRDGRAPDGVVLSVAPALHVGADMLTQKLRVVRHCVADAARTLGTRLPGYVAVYQRMTTCPPGLSAPAWYGVSSATRIVDAERFELVVRAAEAEPQRVPGDAGSTTGAARAAALASLVGWTQRVVIGTLTDPQQPATPWALFGAGWIDCGPASSSATGSADPWERDVQMKTCVSRAAVGASPLPWPLPQPLIEATPRRYWMSPRRTACAHALALLACAAAVASWSAARNNEALLDRIGTDLGRYSMIPAAHDNAKRDALQALVADRDQLDRYARIGVPLRLSLGMYRGAQLLPALDTAIASYVPPAPPPAVVTLDSMSLFDSGRAQLKPGSTRAMVGALEMIRTNPDKRILVAGHTDNVGNPQSNLKLSTARAQAVRDWLIDVSGLTASQFAIQGYGETRPIASNATDDGRAKNRRVEITLVPDAPSNQ